MGLFTAKMFIGKYVVDENTQKLDERLAQYYRETKDCDNRYAIERWREFKKWAIAYSQKDINESKKRMASRRI